MGLLEQVKAGATQMGPLVLVDGRGKEVGRLPAEVISGEVEIHWGDFTRILYEAVRNDVNYRFGVRVTALDDNGQGVDATFSDGSTGSYDLVIGADGLHSGTRRLVFGPEERYVTQLGQCFGFFDIENRLRLDHCGMAYIDAGRTAALQGIDPDKPARASLFLNDPHVAFDYRDTEGNKRLFAEQVRRDGMGSSHTARRPRRGSGGVLRFDRPSPPGFVRAWTGVPDRRCGLVRLATLGHGHDSRVGRRLRAGSRNAGGG